MTRVELKNKAKEQIKGNIGKIFVMCIIIFAINFLCAFIPVFGDIASFIITPVFTLSFSIIYLKITRGEMISVGDLFEGFSNTGRALWLNILISVFTFLWSLLLLVPGIIKSYAYSMSYYVLADNPELTARQALAKSKEITQGHKMELFVLNLSFFWWSLLTILTFGIAGIYVIPYMDATMTNFYNSIKE